MNANYDLLIVTDATASMGVFLNALSGAIPEILALSQLAGGFERVGVISYRDYSDEGIIEWSGWNPHDLLGFAKSLEPEGGGDYPEAAKTALVKALEVVDPTRKTLILWYADAPPHHPSQFPESENARKEKRAHGRRSTDWFDLIYEARASNCTVFNFVSIREADISFYALLSQITGGVCLSLSIASDSTQISQLTLDVLLAWLGQPPAATDAGVHPLGVDIVVFLTPPPVNPRIKDEASSGGYLPPKIMNIYVKPTAPPPQPKSRTPLKTTMDGIPRIASSLPSLTVLAKRFADKSQVDYRQAVYRGLELIITNNVRALSYNPIFGQLWRSVCREDSPEREKLVKLFSVKVGGVQDEEVKKAMKAFVENSYDASEQIEKLIAKAPAGALRIYLDLDVMGPGGVDMTRMELLEVSRSCYSGVIAKLATIFTHSRLAPVDFTFRPNQRFIPLSLPPSQIFRLLPHLVVGGTIFSARSAAVMAILALIVGVPFLRQPAIDVLSRFKGKWVDIDVPENISYEFGRFILQGLEQDGEGLGSCITPRERKFYEAMKRYRLVELNLLATVTAEVPWTPSKTRGVGDEKVFCRVCRIKRSKTIMSSEPGSVGVCGICADADSRMDPADWKDEGDDQSCWMECSVRTCRAQYVIFNAAALKVRPKCWYCRQKKYCPYIECSQCKSRVVMPYYLRSKKGDFLCVACKNGSRSSIVGVETQPKALIDENGIGWLGFSTNKDLFHNISAFKLFASHGEGVFLSHPPSSAPKNPALTLESRPIHNAPQILSGIEKRVAAGTIDLGHCTLCFETFPHASLMPACARSGCHQRVDSACLVAWYGTNRPGSLLNLMRCLCPFCRRKPSAKVISKFNPQVGTLGGLQQAIDDRAWYYAWCVDCGFAKRALERLCCEGERLPTVADFRCEECAAPRPIAGEVLSLGESVSGIRPCPSCGVMVEKTYGCNHISCVCGGHWCYVCGCAFAPDMIYAHMSDAHGGIYDYDLDED